MANYLPNYGGNISTNVVSGNFYANSILPWSPTAGLINDAVDIGNSTLYFKDIYVGNVITPAGDQGNATQIQPASGAGQSGVAFVDAITGSASDVSAGTLYVESIDAIGNVTVDTFVEANEIIALSNVSGTGGNFSSNVSASYFLGNGAFLTGIAAGYSNANVANYLPNYQGLVSNIDFRSTSPAAVAMVVTDRPITIGGNTYSYITIPNDGNANSVATELTNHGLGNVLISSGPDDHEWIFDNTGNLTAPGNIQAGNAVSANYFLGNGALLTGIITNYSNANVANYLATYNGNALFSNVTVSRDAVILGNLRVEGNTTYINVNDLVVDDYLVIIGNAATQVSDLNGAGLQIGNLANSNIQFVYDYTSNVMTLNRGANIANVLNVSGNVTGNYFIGNGALLTGIVTSSYSNANVANYLPTYTGNVTAGNISVIGNVTANWFVGNINTTNSLVTSGNVTANNFIGSDPNVNLIAGSYTWSFNDAGNLVLPSNTFAVNYANGTQVALGGSYSNSVVANYLASNANVTITVGVSNITTQGNISGNYFIGNGALLTGVVTSSYSNANVANYLPTYTGNITAGNIAVTGNVTANWFVGNINTTNSLVTSGNITANNFIGSDPNVGLVAGNYTWLFDNAGNVTLPSNTFAVNYANGTAVSLGGTYSNADVANYLPTYNGNALFSNITVSRDAVILGNLRVEGNTTYINVSDLIVEDKDIIVAANANATMTDLNGAGLQIGNRSAGGNITFFYNSTSNVMTLSHGANIANVLNVAGNITATGNVNTGNLVGSGTNVEIVGGSYTWTFNGSGNLVLPGNTFAVNYANGTQVALAGSYSNTNVKAYLGNFDGNIIPSANVTYDLGSNSNRWNDLYLNNSTIYIGAQEITANADSTIFSGNISVGNLVGTGDNVDIKAGAYTWRFDNAGNLTLPANTSAINYANGATVPVGYGNASVAAYLGSNANLTILSQGNITGNYFIGNGALLTGVVTSSYSNANVANYLPTYTGNIAAGNVTATGNVQGAYILGNGALLTGLPATYGNSNVAAYLASNANVTLAIGTGNITTQGNLAVGNLIGSGDNVDLKAGSYTWRFDSTGNLTLPANSTAIYYANGTQVPVGYGNANVATYLASNSAVTILTTANITTAANISGAYILGNGALLTGLPATYGNSNVAAYLAAYNGNALFSNITVSQDAVVLGNLRVEGNTTYINVSDLIVEDKDIIVAANASATMTDLNGAGLQIGNRTAGGNITFFYNSTSNVMSLSHGANIANVLNVAGNISATGNVSGNWFVGNINTTNSLVTSGNVTANNFVGSGNNVTLASDSYTWTFDNTGNFILPGNNTAIYYANGTQVPVGYGNANVATYLASNANVTVSVGTGNITTQGNISGNYFIGNGALLTGIVTSSYSNANVANYLASNANLTVSVGTGNITTQGNINSRALYLGSQRDVIYQVSGNITLAGGALDNNANISIRANTAMANSYVLSLPSGTPNAGDVLSVKNFGSWSAVGNVANLIWSAPASTYGNTNVAAYLQAYNGNALFSNVTVSRDVLILGNLRVEGNTTEINVSNIFLEDKDIIVAANANATMSDLNGAGLQIGNRTAGGNITFFYNSISNVMSLSHGANIANVLNVDGNIVATGNITGNYILGNGAFLTGLPATYGNSNVAAYLASNSNITLTIGTGNITTQGNVAVGNLIGSGNNVEITAGVYTWTLDNTGNLTLPGNTTAINYANGTPVPVGYGNANVATYLASNSNVTVSVGISNITTQGNISGNYFIGNGALLTGVVTSSYSNANVANYLPTYTGNVSAGNLNLTGNIVDTGAIFVITGASGNIVLAPNGTSRIIATTSGANVIGNLDVAGNVNANGATLTGNLSVGNLIGSGDNVEITAGAYTWTLDNTGNLILPGNATAIYYANGTQVPVGYGNANVATYLASNAAVTILTTANITTAANISGAYILGNGAFLSGLPATYGNSNVAAYLAAYNGNALFSNITVSQDAVILGNLRVEGNTTYINVTDLIVEDKDIIVAANANATLTDLNGAGLQIGNRTSGGNITFFYNSTSNVMSLSHGANIANILNVAGNVTATGNVNTGNLVGSGTNVEIVSGAYTWTFDGAGNLTGTGNVSAGNFVGTSGNTSIVTANYTWTFNSAGNLVLPGNVFGVTYANGTAVSLGGSYSNADVANYLASNANVTVLVGTGNITTQGNIAGNYFIGNGALLTGVVTSSYSNANVANYLPTYTGNITAGNITTTGNVTGNWFVGNVSTTNSLVTSGNVTANNFVGSSGNTSIVTAGYTWVFNDTGNFVLPGNSFSVNYANGAQVSLGGSYSNADVKAYLGNFDGNIIPSANVTYNLGSNSNRWNDLYLNNSTIYIGAQEITANAGATIFSGNISANYILGNGALLTGVASSYGNANVADYLASNANINLAIGTGNITTAGNISVGSIQGANANTTIVANVYSWTFDDTGNLTLPGNSTAIYLANGTQVPLGYNNASVASYMGSNANVTLSIGTGNITTQGNIKSRTLYLGSHQDVSYQAYGNITLSGGSADNNSNVSIVANGAMTTSYVLKLPADTPNAGDVLTVKNFGSQLLFGNVANLIWSAPAGSYTNANVANYLVTYNANALFSNVTVSQNAVILGNLRVEGNTTYINVSDLIVEDKDIIVAANASAALTDLNGAGLQIGNRSAGGNITFFYNSTSNVMTLSHGANIANVLNVAGNITANSLTGSGSNVEIVGGSYTWTFNGSGNLVLPGNAFSVNYANGAQVSLGGSYSNAEAASYLASNANVTILTGVANITTQGNVTAGYFLGNATFAEGVSNTYFGNVSPSSPAQGDIWINSDTAAQLIYFVDANGGQWAEMAAATSISSDGDYTDSNVIALLSSLGGNTISSSANITTTANIQGDYILGNGYFLSGITGGGSYGNANVANYLPTYTGNITAGNISVTGNLSANYIIGNGSQISNITFANITQFATAALTVDELYLQAVTRLGVTASGASGYVFDQYGAGLNPVLYATSGETIAFNLNVAGHPFLIQTSGGSNTSNGLVHVTTTGVVTTGASAQGQVAGTLYWQVPYGITGNYKYQCSIHGGMQNAIVISDGNVANLTVSSAATANTVTTAAQPNITSVGNLTSLIVTGNITGNTEGFTIGYRDVPQVSWSNATMALADASKHYYTSTGGVTLTVPSNANVAFPIGATIAFYNRSSANCTIAPQASVNIFVVGNSTITPTANRTITSNGGGTLTKVDTNTWMLSAANVV